MSIPRVSVVIPIKAGRDEDVVWAQEAIASVKAQTYTDWELYLVNDHSKASLSPLRSLFKADNRLHAMNADGVGVAAARNSGVRACSGTLLLPMDHDDILPEDSMETLVGSWDGEGKDFGVIYGDVLSFGVDYERYMKMPEFLFQTLLNTLIMPIGSLHSKSSSVAIGGWKDKFQGGLEDWAYWIEMCVNGYWGYHVPAITYHYRRHAHGRLASLRTNEDNFSKQRALIREEFQEYYEGKEPKMCKGCGGGRSRLVSGAMAGPIRPPVPAQFSATAATNLVIVKYNGTRQGGFGITGRSTGWKYSVPGGRGCLVEGPSGKIGVHPNDVQFFRGYDGGGTFIVEQA